MKNSEIDGGKAFDWGRASADYARYRDIYPEEFYRRLLDLGICTKGQRVLDLGTGTGVLPRNLYKYGAHFVGADISANQIEQARQLSAQMDIEYIVSPAEELDFPAKSFDAVTACQCFMYFDRSVLLPKIHSWLISGGRLCILFMAWLPRESEIAAETERLVLKYNPEWSGADMQRQIPNAPVEAERLFKTEIAQGFDVSLTFTREGWHGRIRACRGIGASSLSDSQIAEFEREHLAYLEMLPERFEIPHYVTVLMLRKI